MKSACQDTFYDDIAAYYDLIYADWEESMRRHAAAIATSLGNPNPTSCRVLDVSAGIGTQSLPLAALGYEVVARDLSRGSIRRLDREAHKRGLPIDAATADMREVSRSVTGLFDAIIAFDNSLPHLLTDGEIIATLRNWAALLAPGGNILISVRDYSLVNRKPVSVHPYGERSRDGNCFRLSQEWTWHSTSHYRTAMIIEELVGASWIEILRTHAEYYAITVDRLLELMKEAGLLANRVTGLDFFQPVLRAGAGQQESGPAARQGG